MKRRKERLVPLEKSKRVIYLYNCKPERRNLFGVVFTAVLAVLCFLYCLAIALFMGYGTNFFLIWGLMAAVLGFISFLLGRPGLWERLPKWFRRSVCVAGIAGLILFIGTEAAIVKDF